MKKFIISFLWLFVTGNAVIAQKTFNDPNAEIRSLKSFHGIQVATGIKLFLTKGISEEVAVSADKPEYRNKIVTIVEDGILKIQYDNKLGAVNRRNESKGLKAYVSFKSLDLLHVNTGAEVLISDILKTNILELEANTGGIVNGKVEITDLRIKQNTGSKIKISGTAAILTIEGDTGSKFEGEELNTANCNVSVGTGAKISVKAEKELQIKANTGGVVRYSGNAPIRDIKTNTGGTVSKI